MATSFISALNYRLLDSVYMYRLLNDSRRIQDKYYCAENPGERKREKKRMPEFSYIQGESQRVEM